MLLGLFKPGFELTLDRPIRPILITVPSRRIYDTPYMAGACENKPDWTAEILCTHEHRPRWRNMILTGRQVVDRDLHLREVESDAADLHSALGKIVLQIAAPQIEAVVRRRHARRIRVPVQQVKGQR